MMGLLLWPVSGVPLRSPVANPFLCGLWRTDPRESQQSRDCDCLRCFNFTGALGGLWILDGREGYQARFRPHKTVQSCGVRGVVAYYGLGGGGGDPGWRLWGNSHGVVPFIPSVSGALTLVSFWPLRSSVSGTLTL